MQVLAYLDALITKGAAALIPHSPLTLAVFSFITRAGGSFIIWFAFLALLIVFRRSRDYLLLVSFSLSSLITAVLVNFILKNIFMRPRPFVQWHYSALCPNDFSFPSGHAAFSFGTAAMLANCDKKHAAWYYGIAVLISYSRMFLYCHYFSDVIFGAFIGYAVSRLTLYFHHHYIQTLGFARSKNRRNLKNR